MAKCTWLEPWVYGVKLVDFVMGIPPSIFGFRRPSLSSIPLLAISSSLASYRSRQGNWRQKLFLDPKHRLEREYEHRGVLEHVQTLVMKCLNDID